MDRITFKREEPVDVDPQEYIVQDVDPEQEVLEVYEEVGPEALDGDLDGAVYVEDVPVTIHDIETAMEGPSESFLQLCEKLDPGMSPQFKQDAWNVYYKVQGKCCLEGSDQPWFAAAFYTQMHLNRIRHKNSDKPLPYTLKDILHAAHISPLEFFDRATRFVEMAEIPNRILNHCQRVQNSLAISAIVYKKYLRMFRYCFTNTENAETLFPLIWLVYLHAKCQMMSFADDLMRCFHLMLCTFDFILQRILEDEGCAALFTPEFTLLLTEASTADVIFDLLCKTFNGVLLEAKHFKVHNFDRLFSPTLEQLESIPHADVMNNAQPLIELFTLLYNEHLQTKGDYDERSFLPENVAVVFDEEYDVLDVLRKEGNSQSNTVDSELLLKMKTQICLDKVESATKDKDITDKRFKMSADQFCPMTPSARAQVTPESLSNLIPDGWSFEGSDLHRWLEDFRDSPMLHVARVIDELSMRFVMKVTDESAADVEFDPVISDHVEKHKELIVFVCYRILEKIIMFERERVHYRDVDLTAILRKEEFLTSIYAVSVELLLHSYESKRQFPWVLDAVRIHPFHFYKIIEIVVRSELQLCRDLVRHLNKIEEQVLEELAWEQNSPLWSVLAQRADGVPSCEAVWSSDRTELYSPAKRRRLDDENDSIPQSSLLTLFFRKIYFLASVRLADLCDRIKLDEKARCRVWTLVEHFLRTETSLMSGRHLDQNLICCVYMIARLLGNPVAFNTIIRHYKMQPQATSRVYRRVPVDASFISNDPDEAGNSGEVEQGIVEVDVIRYYNDVFMRRMGDFIQKLNSPDGNAMMIPMPNLRPFALSPHKRIVVDRVTVQQMNLPTTVIATPRMGPGVNYTLSGIRPLGLAKEPRVVSVRRYVPGQNFGTSSSFTTNTTRPANSSNAYFNSYNRY